MREQRYLRNLLVTDGKIEADWRQPLQEVSVVDSASGDRVGSAADRPPSTWANKTDGVLERRGDGGEALVTVDGLRLDLDGNGNVPERRRPHPGGTAGSPPRCRPYTAVFENYARQLARPGGPLDADTVRAYTSRVRQFLAWLPDADTSGDPLTDPTARDGAARDYRAYLLTVAKRKASTVNAHLTAIDDFYRRLGLGSAAAKRQQLPQTAPRALSDRDRTRWLRAAERATTRDRALAYTEFYAGTRGAETVALDTDGGRTSARKGHLIIRYGKNGKYREVPLHPKLRTALDDWRTERAGWPGADTNPALFLNARGGRLSVRGAYDLLVAIAEDANLEIGRDADFTPHVLRHFVPA